jgi:F-type H+-transporting ATPase subunit b
VLIDWFTIIAQIVNFLILVALLKHFLYRRVIKAMDERERKIASRLEDAEKKQEQAENEADSYRKKNQELEEKRKEFLSQAREEAEKERKELTQKAREEIDQLHTRWRETLRQEKDSFLQELRQRVNEQVCHIARKAMKDLADADLEGQIVNTFIERLKNLGDKEQKTMIASMGNGGHPITIMSAFEIASNDRQKITKALKNSVKEDIEVEYQTSPDMILGIELRSHGHKLAWSLDDYLESLEASIGRLLEEETREPSETKKEGKIGA